MLPDLRKRNAQSLSSVIVAEVESASRLTDQVDTPDCGRFRRKFCGREMARVPTLCALLAHPLGRHFQLRREQPTLRKVKEPVRGAPQSAASR